VVQPPQGDSVPSAEAEAANISREFMDLTMTCQQHQMVIFIPSTFPLSPKQKDGEVAEMKLFDAVKKPEQILLGFGCSFLMAFVAQE